MMNKKGATIIGIMMMIMIFFAGVIIYPHIEDNAGETRTDLDCTNLSILDGTKLSCLTIDVAPPMFIFFFIILAFGFVVGFLK